MTSQAYKKATKATPKKKGKKPNPAKQKGKMKVSGTTRPDVNNLAPGVRATQLPNS